MLIKGLAELQNRTSGDELYLQAESEMNDAGMQLDEAGIQLNENGNQPEVPICVLMQNQNDGRAESVDGNEQSGSPPDGQEQREQSSNQNNQSDQASQSSNCSSGNRENGPPRQTRMAFHPLSGNLVGCFLIVRGRPNIEWTRTEYERLTRNGNNLVRTYDNFEQALAWLRRKRRRYRMNNPDAADADWSTSDEEDDPNDESRRKDDPNDERRRNQMGGSNRQSSRNNRHSDHNNQQSDGVNISQQSRSNRTQAQNNQSNQSNHSSFQPFDVRSQEFQDNARARRRQSRGYGNRRQQMNVEEDQDDDPHQWMLEFNVTPTGMWENGWMFYNDTEGRIPLNYTLAVAMREGVPGAELEYEHWLEMAKRVSKTLRVITEDYYENYDPDREEQAGMDENNQETEYELR
jgi:hypothetical protein